MEKIIDNHISIAGLEKTIYQDGSPLKILDGVDLSIQKSEIISVLGPSGCGKSTLLNIIAGLDEPDEGDININGLDFDSRLGSVGYMQQKDLLLPWRSVKDNVILGLEIKGVSKRKSYKMVEPYFQSFGLSGFESNYPHTLSGGMKQRASFLRTVMTEPDILLLDEPFSALDALNRSRLQMWLLDLLDGIQQTVLLVTHDVDEAIMLSDRIYVMTSRPGRINSVEKVPYSRPRDREIVNDSSFVELKSKILSFLWDQD
mgnify:FL=1